MVKIIEINNLKKPNELLCVWCKGVKRYMGEQGDDHIYKCKCGETIQGDDYFVNSLNNPKTATSSIAKHKGIKPATSILVLNNNKYNQIIF